MRIRTEDATDPGNNGNKSLRVHAGRSINDMRAARDGLREDGHHEVAARVEATAVEGASALSVYDEESKDAR